MAQNIDSTIDRGGQASIVTVIDGCIVNINIVSIINHVRAT